MNVHALREGVLDTVAEMMAKFISTASDLLVPL